MNVEGREGGDLRDESRDKSGAYVRRRTWNVTFSGGPPGNDVSNERTGRKQRRDAPAPYPLQTIGLERGGKCNTVCQSILIRSRLIFEKRYLEITGFLSLFSLFFLKKFSIERCLDQAQVLGKFLLRIFIIRDLLQDRLKEGMFNSNIILLPFLKKFTIEMLSSSSYLINFHYEYLLFRICYKIKRRDV